MGADRGCEERVQGSGVNMLTATVPCLPQHSASPFRPSNVGDPNSGRKQDPSDSEG